MKKTLSLILAVIMTLSLLPMSFAFAADLGDVTGDGKINSRDIASLQKYIAGSGTLTDDQKLSADINGDGKINSRDIASVQKHVSGVHLIVPSTQAPSTQAPETQAPETQAPAGDGIFTIPEVAAAAKAALNGYTSGTPFYADGVVIDGETVTQPNYYYIAAKAIQDIYNNNASAAYKSADINMAAPSMVANYTFEYTEVNQNFYMNFAIRQTVYADNNKRIGASAGYPTTDSNANGFPVTDFEGQFNYEAGLLMFTRILASYADNGTLPATVAVEKVPSNENAPTQDPSQTQAPATQAPSAPAVAPTEHPALSTNLTSGSSTFKVSEIAAAAETIVSHYDSFKDFATEYSIAKALPIGNYVISDQDWAYLAGYTVAGLSGAYAASNQSGYTKDTVVTYKNIGKPAVDANNAYGGTTLKIAEVAEAAWKAFSNYANSNGLAAASCSSVATIDNKQLSYYSILMASARALKYFNENGNLPASVDFDALAYSKDDNDSYVEAPVATAAPSTAAPTGSLTVSEIVDGMAAAYAEFEVTDKLPATLTIGSVKDMNQATYFAAAGNAIIAINSGNTAKSINIKGYNDCAYPNRFDTFDSETISKKAIIYIAEKQIAFANNNGMVANYTTFPGTSGTSYSGLANFDRCLIAVVRLLAEYKETGVLSETVSSWASDYTTPTLNCESDNADILAQAQSIIAGKDTDEAKAKALFEWVQSNVTYSYYENTRRSAIVVHNDKVANCCDHAHYLNALARSVGIPARYAHIYGFFGENYYGHVFSELFVNGQWVVCDASMKSNTYGNHEAWTLDAAEAEHYANYIELYF